VLKNLRLFEVGSADGYQSAVNHIIGRDGSTRTVATAARGEVELSHSKPALAQSLGAPAVSVTWVAPPKIESSRWRSCPLFKRLKLIIEPSLASAAGHAGSAMRPNHRRPGSRAQMSFKVCIDGAVAVMASCPVPSAMPSGSMIWHGHRRVQHGG